MLVKSLFINLIQKRFLCVNSILKNPLKVTVENKIVIIEDKNLNLLKFPRIWLRDNCQCNECFHQSSKSRKINWEKFNTNVKIDNITAQNETIKIDWSDQHSSIFQLDWLKGRDFNSECQKKYLEEFYRPNCVHWGRNSFKEVLTKYNYKDVMQDDEALRNWLHNLAVNGVAIIENSPSDKGAVRKIADRVGFIRRTTYGEEFIVESKPGAKNYAYLSTPLPLHTDLPYYEYKPSVNILHCLVQSNSSGGSNLLADGFYVADLMKSKYPESFKILTETAVDWNDIGEDGGKKFHNIWRSPVICLDGNGKYTRINHSVPQRDSHFTIDIEQVQSWYDAYAKFVQILHEECVTFKINPGDVLTFNNIRLVHGRSGYDDTENNVRCIVGAYLDWDIIYSKLRVLKHEIK